MKNIPAQLLIASLFLTGSLTAKALTDSQIVDKYIPQELLDAKIIDIEPPVQIMRSAITKIFKSNSFNSKDGTRYIIVIYSTIDYAGLDIRKSKFSVIKIAKDGSTALLERPSSYELLAVGDRSKITVFDLNADGIVEVIITNKNLKGDSTVSYVLKWSGSNLENITPLQQDSGSSALTELDLDALPLIVYEQYIPSQGSESSKTFRRAFQLRSGSFTDLGTFDFAKTVSSEKSTAAERTFDQIILKEGLYTLEVENFSQLPNATRVEVSVNGDVVLRPEDFCAHSVGKAENGLKHCKPKDNVYADVTLSKENYLSVKLYGNKHSRVLVSLKRKAN